MRKTLTWLAGAVGLAALARHRARQRAAAAVAPTGTETDPAEELRRKLAGQRLETETPATPVVEEPETDDEPVDLDARRAEVHARAQDAIDLMREEEPPGDPNGDAVA